LHDLVSGDIDLWSWTAICCRNLAAFAFVVIFIIIIVFLVFVVLIFLVIFIVVVGVSEGDLDPTQIVQSFRSI
jgi:hypothetical protein